MKKIFGVIFGAMALACCASAQAISQPCGTNSVAFSNLLPGGAWAAQGCEIGDFEFTNFVVTSGTIDSPISDVFAQFGLQGGNNQQANFDLTDDTNDFVSSFTLTYKVTIDPTEPPANSAPPGRWQLDAASAGLLDDGFKTPDSVTWAKTVATSSGTILGTDTVTDVNDSTGSSGVVSGFLQLSLNVTDTYTVHGVGDIFNLSNSYVQIQLAEPSTMILLGVALVGLGVFVRKRRKACA